MKAKKEIVKYAGGGPAAAAAASGASSLGSLAAIGGGIQAGLGVGQTIYGIYSAQKAQREFERAKAAAPSLETPGQFYENYRNAYDSELARMETDAIQSNLATSVQALQGAGGRALVGGLTAATRQAQESQNRMLAQERAMRAQAGQQLAIAEERAIGRKEARSQQELAYANQAYQAAVGNIAAGVGSAAEGLMYMSQGDKKQKDGDGLLSKAKGKFGEFKKNRQEKKDFKSAVEEVASRGLEYEGTVLESVPEIADNVQFDPKYRQQYEKDRMAKATAGLREKSSLANMPDMGIKPRIGMQLAPNLLPKAEGINYRQDLYSANTLAPMVYSGAGQAQLQPVNMPTRVETRYEPMGSPVPKSYRDDQTIQELQGAVQAYAPFKGFQWYNMGGMMTNGAYNHNTNPIDLVQDGQKVGEATGGEYIVNPMQAAAIAKESSYARKLFKRFEKNAKKNK